MNINVSLIGQIITFLVFVWFVMKFVWPPIIAAMEEREKRIADGLAAAERGKQDLAAADAKVEEMLREARQKAAQIVDQANKRGSEIVEEAKAQARSEGERLVVSAKAEIAQEVSRAKESLRAEVAGIAVAGASQILKKEVDASTHARLLDDLVAEM